MRICIDIALLSSKQGTGGRTYVTGLIKSLSMLDKKNQYIYCGVSPDADIAELLSNNIEAIRYPASLIFPSLKYTMWYYSDFSRQLTTIKPDIYMSPYPILPICCPGSKVVVVHDIIALIEKGYSSRFKLPFTYQLLDVIKRANVIIADSISTKKDLIVKFNVLPERIHVVYPGYDASLYKVHIEKKAIESTVSKYSLDGPYLLYTGTLLPHKNILRLLRAFAKLKSEHGISHKLLITGPPQSDNGSVSRAINQLRLTQEVILAGHVDLTDLPHLYHNADAFVYPSLYEGFGLPPLEAMACGTPVIASNISSLPEVVGEAALLVDPYSVDAIAEAICRVITDRELHLRMRQKGIERARLFSWTKAGGQILGIFESTYEHGLRRK